MCGVVDPQLRDDKRIEIDTSFGQANRVDLMYDARIFVTDGHRVGETSRLTINTVSEWAIRKKGNEVFWLNMA